MGTIWAIPLWGTAVVLTLLVVFFAVRARPRRGQWSDEERLEWADAPMPLLQRRALWGLLVIGLTFAAITVLLVGQGAVATWNDDVLRPLILLTFIGGLVAHFGITNAPLLRGNERRALDERDRAILARASVVQTAVVVLGLAAWVVILGERFHDEGAVPMVYLNLVFGSVLLLMLFGQSLGIVLGYWSGVGHGEA